MFSLENKKYNGNKLFIKDNKTVESVKCGCNECFVWKMKYSSLYRKYDTLRKGGNQTNNHWYYDIDMELNLLFNHDDNIEKKVKICDSSSKTIIETINNDYYIYDYIKYHDDKNTNIDKIYKNVNKYNDDKRIINIKVILEWFKLYDFYFEEKNKNDNLSFEDFINYNKKKFKYIEKTYNFKYKVYRCYKFILKIKSKIPNYENNDILIEVLTRCNLTYGKLYKLKKEDINILVNFIFEKYTLIKESKEIKKLNIVEKNVNSFPHDVKNQMILKYPGNKYKLLKNHINTFNFNGKECFIDTFAGSLTTSLIVRNMFKDIKIVAFEKNTYLINFYENLKNNPHELINKIKDCILELNNINIEEKNNFIKNNIVLSINNNKYDSILTSSWFFLLNKISYSHVSYTKKGKILIDIDKKVIDKIKINEIKFLNFSKFLNTIILIKHDFVKEGYNIIDKYITTEKSIVYLDPPYITEHKKYRNYGTIFNIEEHDKLFYLMNNLTKKNISCIMSNDNDIYIKKLYKNYNVKEIELIATRHNKIRKEVLIYNYNMLINTASKLFSF